MDKKQVYEGYFQGQTLTELSKQSNIPVGTLKSWAHRESWKRKEVVLPGAPNGNQNAVANQGGSPPIGNRNALRTGEYEQLTLFHVSEEEAALLKQIPREAGALLQRQLDLLHYRESKMLQRLYKLEEKLSEEEKVQVYERRKVREYQSIEKNSKTYHVPIEKEELVLVKEQIQSKNVLGRILAIEEALTRISAQILKVVSQREALLQEKHIGQPTIFDWPQKN
ncbi:hypothetical protein ACWMU4_002777 [Listeria monocytogenes]